MHDTTYATFYFGKVTEGSELYDTFEQNGHNFYFKVEVEKEEFRITDTCGRMVPFDRDSLKALNLALFGTTQTYAALESAETLYNKKINELEQLMSFYSERA